ncbi:exopolygalacturonase-like [Impatiens glandulifera]|uniref:exopolygalacturonase-like n=1 Tax=Impatiens glandulifera TaxID=253017 RepID=UPI001FB0750C|nr:exopolygalacturonase-like [Impatiens glandulifera]
MAQYSIPTLLLIILILCFLRVSDSVSVSEAVFRPHHHFRSHSHSHRGENKKIFNVLQFGAKSGGIEDSTQAFEDAWQAACRGPKANGKTKVIVPHGKIFKVSSSLFAGPCKASSIVFEIQGNIRADTDLSNYPYQRWLSFESVTSLTLTGNGTIDGQGNNMWQYNDCKTNPHCIHLPSALYFNNVNSSLVRGIHLVNAMGFHMHITNSNAIRVKGVQITSPGSSPNTDGIHISKTHSVQISATTISTGDDCISIGQGSTHVSITKVVCGPGHGISVGSLGKVPQEQDVRGLIVSNCTLMGTTNGLRIKTWPKSDPSKATGIIFRDIIMLDVKNPIIIDQSYGDRDDRISNPSRVQISDIVYQNIRGTSVSAVAVNLMCSKLVPCDNVRMTNIRLVSVSDNVGLMSACTNARVGYMGMQIPPPCLM